MKRSDLTEKILDIKREKNWSRKHITGEIGGMSEVLVVGALLGQMKLTKPLCEKAARLFGLSESEQRPRRESGRRPRQAHYDGEVPSLPVLRRHRGAGDSGI
jgi:cyanate lyase